MNNPKVNVVVSGNRNEYHSTYKTYILRGGIPFADQVIMPDTKYVIKYDFDLGGGAFDLDFSNADTHTVAEVTYYYIPFIADGSKYTLIDDTLVFVDAEWNGLSAREIKPEKGTLFMIASITGGLHKNGYGINVVTVPENCILEFDGGSLKNGTIIGQNTVFINIGDVDIWGENLTKEGIWRDHSGGSEKDKPYDPEAHSGLGKKFLRLKPDGSNILTQEDFDQENTIYVSQYDFELGGEEITIPENCILEFDGGSLDNGTIVGNNTSIEAGLAPIFGSNLTIDGTWNIPDVFPDWFAGSDADKIENAIKNFGSVKLASRQYNIDRQINVYQSFRISGNSIPDAFRGTRFNLKVKTASILKAVGNISSIICVTQNREEGAYFYSGLIEGVTFTADDLVAYQVNGLSLNNPGGPGRPWDIHDCNFQNLNYGIHVYGSDASASTNIANLHVHDNNINRNNWGIRVEGRHGLMNADIDNNVIEQNLLGGIYIFDEEELTYYSAFSSWYCRNNMLEGQPTAVNIKSNGSVIIEGNYYENSTVPTDVIIKGNYATLVTIRNNHIPQSGTKVDYHISDCSILEFNDEYYYEYINTRFDTCAFFSKPLVPVNEVHSCFACYDDESDVKYAPTIETKINKNYRYSGRMCMYSTPTNDTVLGASHPQLGSIAAGTYRMVFYTYNENRVAIMRLLDTTNSVYYGPGIGNDNVNIFNFIKNPYKRKCIRYITDIELPNISSFSVYTMFYKDIPNVSAISEMGLYNINTCNFLPSFEKGELFNEIYVGETDYYKVKKDFAYRQISSAVVGTIFSDTPVDTPHSDCCEIAVKANDVIEFYGVFWYVILDSSNVVLKKKVSTKLFWPERITERISVDGKICFNVANEGYKDAGGNIVPYANTHYIPYKIRRVTLTNY